jgi:hypothetical protein
MSKAMKAGVLPSGWRLHDWKEPSYKAVEVDGDLFALEDTAWFTTRYLDSTMAVPFKVVLKCAFDGKMEEQECSIGRPAYTVDQVRFDTRMKEQQLMDSLNGLDLSFK